jgi:hypothetical protein
MKIINQVILGAVALSFASAIHTFAIEGLQVSVQCSNVVLSWPSIEGKNYIVQYRQTLNSTDSWQTLTSSWPAAAGANVTVFVHSNIVQHPNCGSGGSFARMFSSGNTVASASIRLIEPGPMVIPANGSGGAVPLALYPPGIDLSGLVIFDPMTGESLNGAGYTTRAASLNSPQLDGPQPLDGGGGGSGDPPPEPETGFYQVVQDGVKILDSTMAILTNGILSNNVTIGLEAGDAANDGTGTNVVGVLNSATLVVDGAAFPGYGGVLSASANSTWQFSMDTACLENGTHTLQVEATWYDPNFTDDNHVYPTRISDPVTITVSNQIYYPNWEPEVGEAGISAYFAKTTCTVADWTIDIYDVNSNFVQRLSGHTTDGTIEAYWNMVDTNGVTRTNADVDPEFSSIITVSDPASKQTPKKKQRRRDWPGHGIWTIAYLDYFKHFYSANNDMKGHINAFANTAGKYGGYWLYYPQPGQTNDIGQTYPLRFQNPQHPEDGVTAGQIAKDSTMLKAMLANTNSRNFFYRGHGGPTSIGHLSSSDINTVVKHRYRFVMLQDCDSANGDLDKAFGINGPGRFALTYYQNTGIRPAAFVGNTTETPFAYARKETINGVNYDGDIPWQVPYFYYEFLFYWDTDLEGETLNQAIIDARNILPPTDNFNPQPGAALEIYGYDDMRIDEYNHRTDWP